MSGDIPLVAVGQIFPQEIETRAYSWQLGLITLLEYAKNNKYRFGGGRKFYPFIFKNRSKLCLSLCVGFGCIEFEFVFFLICIYYKNTDKLYIFGITRISFVYRSIGDWFH